MCKSDHKPITFNNEYSCLLTRCHLLGGKGVMGGGGGEEGSMRAKCQADYAISIS